MQIEEITIPFFKIIKKDNLVAFKANYEYFTKLIKFNNTGRNTKYKITHYSLCDVELKYDEEKRLFEIVIYNLITYKSNVVVNKQSDGIFRIGNCYLDLSQDQINEISSNCDAINKFLSQYYHLQMRDFFDKNKSTSAITDTMFVGKVEEKLQNVVVLIPDKLREMVSKYGELYSEKGKCHASKKMLSFNLGNNEREYRIIFRKAKVGSAICFNDIHFPRIKIGRNNIFSTEKYNACWEKTEKNQENLLLIEMLFKKLNVWYEQKLKEESNLLIQEIQRKKEEETRKLDDEVEEKIEKQENLYYQYIKIQEFLKKVKFE